MKKNKISFITPIEEMVDKKIVLDKSYSQEFFMSDGSTLSISSNKGNKEIQQDCLVATENNGYLLLLVADGMGGMLNGEKASYITAKTIKKWLESEDKDMLKILNRKTLGDVLTGLMYLISQNIPELSGSTLNMSIITPNETLIANVGDSRTYTIKDGKITLRTTDDSVVFKRFAPQTESDRNRLRFHKENNIITNTITKETFPTITITKLKNDDYDIICHLTDGVTDFLTESLISSYAQGMNPAIVLVNKSTTGLPIYNYRPQPYERKIILPGEDNATAIVYTKKRTKNN